MNSYGTKTILKVTMAAVLSLSAGWALLGNLKVNAADSEITIDADSSQPYTVPQDSTGKAESNIGDDFVQGNIYKPNLQKISLKSYSSTVYSSIQQSFKIDDNTFLSVLMVDNQTATGAPYRIATDYVVKTDLNGNIIASKSIPKNTAGINPTLTATSGNFGEYSRYYAGKQVNSNSIMLYYSGQKPGDTSTGNRAVLVDTDLNMTYYDISIGSYTPQQDVEGFGYIKYTNEIVNIGFMYPGWPNSSSFEVYTVGDNGVYTNKRQLTAPSFSSIIPGTRSNNWIYLIRNNSLAINASGNMAGIVNAYDNPSGTPVNGYAVVLWDSAGNILNQYTLDYLDSRPIPQTQLSDENYYYFLENDTNNSAAYLKKMDMQTGEVTLVQTFPFGTNIQISRQNDPGMAYSFFGSITDASGIFAGYAPAGTGGSIYGYLNSDYSLVNASVVSTNGSITQNDSINANAPYMFVDGSTTATDFSDEPDNGWQDQTQLSNNRFGNAFFGAMAMIRDYAPAINVGAPAVINKDTVTDWDTELLNGVQVTDTYDLAPDQGNRTQDWLNARLNRNPLNPESAYDWDALGLDKTKIGPNTVTYFITDSSLQTTADSKIVNVVANSTEYDTDQTLALDAHNFVMPLADAASLTAAIAKDSTHGNVQAWNMTDGSDLYNGVTVDQAQYQAIVNATKVGPYPLTFRVSDNGITVNNTVIVSLIDDNTIVDNEKGEAVYAHDFTIHKSAVAGLTDQSVIQNAEAFAWNLNDGSNVAITPEYAQVIATVGTYPATFTTAAGTQKTINVHVVDDSTTDNNDNGSLPFTGEHLLEMALLGLAGIAAGMFIIFRRRKNK